MNVLHRTHLKSVRKPLRGNFQPMVNMSISQAHHSTAPNGVKLEQASTTQQLERCPLSISTVNQNVINAQYAVRGEIVQMAQKLERDLREQKDQYPFEKVVWCNIGNPQLLGQKPITYFRQVLALCECPQLLEHKDIRSIFPSDVIQTAQRIMSRIPGGMGAYSESPGAQVVREMVADAIERRDGHACSLDDIFMTDGASPGVHYLMLLLLRNANYGLMVPIPQYPLYSATLSLYGGQLVPYQLDEDSGWALNVDCLRESLRTAREKGVTVRGVVVINPGNPTGQCLPRSNMEEVVAFCKEEGLVLVADEVYQANIYVDNKEFFSFKKVMREMGVEIPLASLHSISKGFIGECGRRGGYMEVVGFPPDVKDQILKLASINLCPNLSGQICCALMMNPPNPGEPSYEVFAGERDGTLTSLRQRSKLLVRAFNALPGVRCNEAEGALYAFPRVAIPPAAVAAAAAIGKPPDWLYCAELLRSTGIVVVPGSGFGQADGTWHFRTTFLPPEEDMVLVADAFRDFHTQFMKQYGGPTTIEEAGTVERELAVA